MAEITHIELFGGPLDGHRHELKLRVVELFDIPDMIAKPDPDRIDVKHWYVVDKDQSRATFKGTEYPPT